MKKVFGYHIHNNLQPFHDAPAWATELALMLAIIMEQGITTMSVLDDLKADLADFIAKVKADHDSLTAQVADLSAKLAAGSTVTDADLEALMTTIDTAKATVVAAPVVAAPVAPAPAAPADAGTPSA